MPKPTIPYIGSYDDLRELHLLHHIFSLPNLDSIRNNPKAVLAEIDKFSAAPERHMMTIGPNKGPFIENLIVERKPSTVVELGGFIGYSAILFGNALRSVGGKRYLSLEINPVNAAVANQLVELAGLRDIVTILVAPSHKSIARFVRENSIDHIEFLFLDHWKDRYLPDLWLIESLGLLKPGVSVLAADNCLTPGAPEYLAWVRAAPAQKAALLKEHRFPGNVLQGEDLIKAIKSGVEDVELEDVPGDAGYLYDTSITKFQHRSGRVVSLHTSFFLLPTLRLTDNVQDGVEVTKVIGKE
ncbi:putative O-methyltransferase [Talaromyces proteolyticus]|uniref:catechol O-methyltransferase n=1 Tax=Talaromyces proteolyticus TaxID=1131652 RepID=A0AAD4KIH4_9EURO|nr:putative O-methyltransferase [Talaromyces proteolyticus]KAH8691143.1 putative O-methyltransferase [Talaromyces proteolyticus]